MNILWIGSRPAATGTGAEVLVDGKLIAVLRQLGHQVSSYHPPAVSRVREVLNLSLGRRPYYRARYESARTRREIRALSAGYDAVVASWEPYDQLALESTRPVVLLLHNITSAAIRSVFPGSMLGSYLAWRGARAERRTYSSARLAAVATLSAKEQQYVRSISNGVPVVYAPPGMPRPLALADDAQVVPELLISGTYGWFPKRRDVIAFAREYAGSPHGSRIAVLADELPDEARPLLNARPLSQTDDSREIRFGLITDRFESGHKLKTTYYLARNAIVLSYADVVQDFEQIQDHSFFIRRVRDIGDVAREIERVKAVDPSELRERLRTFKQRCQESFSWERSAHVLADALAAAVGPGVAQRHAAKSLL